MPVYLARVSLKAASGIPADVVVNDFVIDTVATDIDPSNVGIVSIPVAQLYTVASPTTGWKLGEYLSGSLSRTADVHKVDVYNLTGHLDGSAHGSPVATDTFTLPAALSTSTLPEECAVVATLRGAGWDTALVETPDADTPPDGKVDRPRQRRSGRIYFGPFVKDACVLDGTSLHSRTDNNLRATILDAFDAQAAVLDADGCEFVVWSRKDADVYGLVRVEVDNAFDTQRSRGPRATVRDAQAI